MGEGDTLDGLAFRGEWRRYQELALAAFEEDRRRGRRRTHIVAPPGSGKTLLGVEIVRRLGTPALVLVPNSAVQAQWLETAQAFGAGPGVAAAGTDAPLACLTYQALAQLDDPAVALGNLAERRWAADRAAATGSTRAEVERDARGWSGDAAARRARELARISASLKREIARAEHGGLHLGDLLSSGARARLDALRSNGVGTIVLDECHHLASLWGYVVRTAVEELGDVHLVGLTATPPDELTREEAELYEALLGGVDFTVPTPAVVRERFLAPYQELAWLTEPLDSETAWLAEHDLRFQELVTALHDGADGVPSLPAWVIERMRERRRAGDEEAAVPWASFQRAHPALARAGARLLVSGGLELPPGVPRGEGYREQPSMDDWLVLLEDYALRCLAADPTRAAAARYEAIAAALRTLGFTLTRRGIRRGASEVDRLLAASAAKPLALVEVVACEYDARGERLRALVLADAERAGATPDESLAGVLAAGAGTAPQAVCALAGDGRTAGLRPLLVSGRGLRCAERDGDALLAALRSEAGDGGPTDWRVEPDDDGLVRLTASGSAWQPGLWVELATRIFTAGVTQALVGTRALLGEGWDAPCVNCLVDLSAATTSVSVTQMRGRSLRLDPADPEKIASNWDVVCVAPGLAGGSADYDRFVRKHLHVFAPSEDGAIEAGPSHVHPALGPFAPPPAAELDEIDREMRRRAAGHEAARKRWRIGEPYAAEERRTLVVRPRRPVSTEHGAAGPPAYPIDQRAPYGAAVAAGVVTPLAAAAAHDPLALAGLVVVPAALGWAAQRLGAVRDELADVLPLDLAAHAVCDAYRELGELTDEAAASLAIEPRASGYLRCSLPAATAEESDRFALALDQVISPVAFPRYVVSRLVRGSRSRLSLLVRSLVRRPPFERRWSALPDDLGRNKERAEVFARAWRRWLGPSELRFTQRSAEGRETVAAAGAQGADYETSTRRVWV